jgi:hypothetical protein
MEMIYPKLKLKLPLSGKETEARPFTVAEEKILLMASESKDPNEIREAVWQCVENCTGLLASQIPWLDVNYLFIILRSKSVGNTISMNYTCQNVVDKPDADPGESGPCGCVFETNQDITTIQIDESKIEKEIQLPGYHLTMDWPSHAAMNLVIPNESDFDFKIRIMWDCLVTIYNGTKDEVFSKKDINMEDFQTFAESLSSEHFMKLEEYLDNLPSLYLEHTQDCPKCGFTHTMRHDEFADFFI